MIINCLKKLYVKIILLIIALFFCSIPANACTLYSAVGDNVANKGTLIPLQIMVINIGDYILVQMVVVYVLVLMKKV